MSARMYVPGQSERACLRTAIEPRDHHPVIEADDTKTLFNVLKLNTLSTMNSTSDSRVGPPLRVEVVPVGFYVDRVVEPILSHRADRVYLLRTRDDGQDRAAPFRERALRALLRVKPDLEIRIVRTDLFSMDSAVESFSAIISQERQQGNTVWVNLSTGSKLEAVAAAIACMAHGGTPYYVRMKSYDRPSPSKPLASGVQSIDVVPTFGLAPPSPLGLAVLTLLGENEGGLAKKSLISGLIDLGLVPPVASSGTVQARYGRLQAVLDELQAAPPMVVTDGKRKSARVRLTDRGRLALRIYSPRLGVADFQAVDAQG